MRGWQAGAVVAAAIALLAVWSATASGAARTFEQRFATNDTGDVTIVANTLMTCPAADAQCAAAQAGTASPASANNNNAYVMQYVDADPAGGPGIFNSSSADLALPPGATVLKAMLYWGGDSGTGDGGAPPPNAAARDTVQLKVPGETAYQPLLASQLDFLTTDGNDFQGAVDVTRQVAAAGAGTYWVGNVQAGTGRDRQAGWSLVVAYRDTAQPPRNLSIFDGFQVVNSGNRNVTIGVDGFKTPPTGAVSTQLGFVAYEGDAGSTGDSAKLNTTTLRDATNPANNFFNSAISHGGVQFTAKDPNYVNQLGYDSIISDASGILGNGDTSAAIRLTTGGETYFPGVVTFATELIAPDVELSKAVQDLGGGLVEAGDTLRYTVRAANTGPDDATNVVISDEIPDHTAFVPGSLTINGVPNPPGAFYDPATRRVFYNVGTGATSTHGGILEGGRGTAVVTFDVTVDSVPAGTQLVNAAHADFFARTLGAPLSADSNAATSTVAAPDLVVAKTPANFVAVGGGTVDFTLTVTNSGTAATDGRTVTVTDDFPGGLGRAFDEVVAVGGAGWTCTPAVLPAAAPVSVECSRSDRLAAGASYPAISITARATDPPPVGSIANTAIVMGGGDADLSNNAGTNVGQATTRADLSLFKTATPLAALTGEQVTFRVRVRNGGPSLAPGVVVDDFLPAGLAADSASASQGSCTTGPVTCNLGDLAVGAEATVTVVATVNATGPGPIVATNIAEVRSAVVDPVTDNNGSNASVTVAPTADVSIVKEASPDPLDSTAPAIYTLRVHNDGPQTALGVHVTDPLPAGFVFGSAVSSQGDPCTHTPADNTVRCPLGPIVSGGDATVTITGTLLPSTEGTVLSNSAVVTTTTGDPDLTDNAATTTSVVIPAADVELSKTVDEAAPRAGGQVTYSLAVTNNGPSSALNVQVTDALPAGLTLVSAPGCAAAGGSLTCDAGTLASGASRTFAVTATVGDSLAGQQLSNLASAGSDTRDPLTANNSDDATIAVTPRDPEPPRPPEPPVPPTTPTTPTGPPVSPAAASADLVLGKRALGRAVIGERLRYELVVRNRGPQAASDVVVTDTLPRSVRFVSARTAAGRCASAPALRCQLGTLASGARASIVLTVVPQAAGELVNAARVSAATADPNTANNAARSRVDVAPEATRLVVSKTADRRTVRAGGLVGFTIAVRVAGPGDARGLRVCDRLPAGLSYRSAPGAQMRRGNACWTRSRVAAGTTLRFRLTAHVARTARAGTLANTAVATGANARAVARARARLQVLPAAGSGRGGGVTG
ncbi:conserved repeat domain protein [Conexibacter woesei DSM 14684]|uniref:Conserved repeat domain protein n=1 Tax=Conexibacter woesei (strain DSM 14684 / CCUG 47730 / CIP 108061 / JCM 11494 / NBRC 100937 / ID131577) TaxID=469383 RepID=D3F7N4_CONWI|nr:conserved repeat domain protein [Conexibacter woesei DSM 14684]